MEQMEALFASGQMTAGFEALQQAVKAGTATIAMQNHYNLLVGLGYLDLPVVNAKVPQFTEDGAEQYKVLAPFYQLIATQDANAFGETVEALQQGDDALQAEAYFLMATYFGVTKAYDKAFAQHAEALRLNPNQALYWGHFAQTVQRGNGHPLLALRLIEQAIALDPLNARYYVIQHYIFMQLLTMTKNLNYSVSAEEALHAARKRLRPEQKPLQIEIAKAQDMLQQWQQQIL